MVRQLGMPFREAHRSSGAIVAAAASKGVGLEDMSLEELQEIEPQIKPDLVGLLSAANSAAARTSFGGTAPIEVRARIAEARQRFAIG